MFLEYLQSLITKILYQTCFSKENSYLTKIHMFISFEQQRKHRFEMLKYPLKSIFQVQISGAARISVRGGHFRGSAS